MIGSPHEARVPLGVGAALGEHPQLPGREALGPPPPFSPCWGPLGRTEGSCVLTSAGAVGGGHFSLLGRR